MLTDPASLHRYQRFAFQLEIDGVTRAGFSEVGGLTYDADVVDYREGQDSGGAVRKPPAPGSPGRITLKRGVTADRSLWDWRRGVVDGQTRRAPGAIIRLDAARRPLQRWTFQAGWPARWEGPDFDAGGNEVTIETLEIAHEGLRVCR